ncbi:hypothetical protein UXP18_14430, partial [Enterobacter asburiae]|uniref:hypothetical protein n=2 Tax=Enterobacter asburiae TaxID=61645 RepID=UPI002FD06C3A
RKTPHRKVRGFLLCASEIMPSGFVGPVSAAPSGKSNRTIPSLKLSHLLLADSTFKPFLGIVSCLDV